MLHEARTHDKVFLNPGLRDPLPYMFWMFTVRMQLPIV